MRPHRKSSPPQLLVGFALWLAVAGSSPARADNAPPVITAPATITAQEGVFFSVTITATAADSTATVTLTGPSPFCGISFSSSPGVGQATGTLSGTPEFTCAGFYALTFTANDGVSSSSTTVSLTIQNTDRAPIVSAPQTLFRVENEPFSFVVASGDPDGDAITSLTSASSPATTGSVFTTSADNRSGTFSWTPSFTQAGGYTVTTTASSGNPALSTSASTVLSIQNGDRPPNVFAPATATGNENSLISFQVTAVDPEGTPASLGTPVSSPPATGSTFTVNGSGNIGTFSWTPSFTQAGSYDVTFTAGSNGLTGSAATAITVVNVDRAPVVTAPATQSVPENQLLTFTALATEPDGEAITSFTAASSPPTPGSTFTTSAGNTSGTFSWTPSFTAAGAYSVTFTASNALSGSATTSVVVCSGCDRAPVVTAPATVSGSVQVPITFTVSAADPDGEAIASFMASGTAISAGGTFSTNPTNTSGTFSWTPASAQAGTFSVTFTASNALSGSGATQIIVSGDQTPVVTAPATAVFRFGLSKSVIVSASDADGEPIASLTASSSPAATGSQFVTNPAHTSGTFEWTPVAAQEGTYAVTFTASNALTGTAVTTITVCGCNRPPVLSAPPLMTSADFHPISFTVNVLEPDGDAITSLTAASSPPTTGSTFTVSPTKRSGNFDWSPTAAQAGSYSVTFTATESYGSLQGTAITQIVVGQALPARAFTTNPNKAIILNSGKARLCAHVEAVSGSFQVTNIQLGSVVLRSPGTGSVSEIPAITGKTNIQGDVDHNGIDDVEFCFAKGGLLLLFSNLSGRTTVNAIIAGRLMSGQLFEAPITIDVIAPGGGSMASVAPNPLNPSGTLSFRTERSGAVKARLFDSSGRLVRTVWDGPLHAGPHAFALEARDAAGLPLASGVYFYRIETPGHALSGRFVVAK